MEATVLFDGYELKGLESTFKNFIFGTIVSG